MNSQEINDIKTTWAMLIPDPSGSGSAILLEFFKRYPHNLEKFNIFQGIDLNELGKSPRFKVHAKRIIFMFDNSVQAFDTEDPMKKLQQIWLESADSHFNKKISKQSYNELKECILDVVTAACKLNDHQAAAWVKFLDIAYGIVFKRYDELEAENA